MADKKDDIVLSIRGMSKSFGRNRVLDHINLDVRRGTVMGLMGENGAGKSTLLKVIAGYTVPDEGTVSARNGLNTVYLGQQVEFGPDATVRSFLYESDSPLIRTIREYEEAVEAGHESTHLLERIQDGDLWGIERSYYGYLGSLGADIGPERTMASLSGGEAKKAAVARALALRPELLLLDEEVLVDGLAHGGVGDEGAVAARGGRKEQAQGGGREGKEVFHE